MNALQFIWFVSLSLTGAALIVIGILIVARLFITRRERRRAAKRRVLVRELLAGGASPADSLGRIPPELLTDTFLDLIRLVRGDEREAFVAQATGLGVPERLGRRLQSGSARKRLSAAQSLGEFHDPGSLRALHGSLDDSNEDVRLAAALSLAQSGSTAEVRQLVDRLGLGVDEDSLMIVTLFRVIAEERPDEIKALILDPDTNVRARLAGIEALATTGDYSLVPVITALALDAPDNGEELPRYLRALGTLAHPAGAQAVLQGLTSAALGARAAAAFAAGRIGLIEGADRLAELLDDPDWWVRFRAAEALIQLGPAGRDRLQAVAARGSMRAQEAAGTMLAEFGAEG